MKLKAEEAKAEAAPHPLGMDESFEMDIPEDESTPTAAHNFPSRFPLASRTWRRKLGSLAKGGRAPHTGMCHPSPMWRRRLWTLVCPPQHHAGRSHCQCPRDSCCSRSRSNPRGPTSRLPPGPLSQGVVRLVVRHEVLPTKPSAAERITQANVAMREQAKAQPKEKAHQE